MLFNLYGARFYDPSIGRFTGVDPLADQFHGWNPYHYVHDNPINMIDPTGMSGESHHEDEDGNFIAVYDDGDTGVYEHENGTTKEDVDEQREGGKYTGRDGNYIGEMEDHLDPSTLNQNLFDTNYTGPDNPMTYPDADGKRKADYTAEPANISDAMSKLHDLEYGAVGIAGKKGLFTDSKGSAADFRFYSNQKTAAKVALANKDYKTLRQAIGVGYGLGAAAIPKTIYKFMFKSYLLY